MRALAESRNGGELPAGERLRVVMYNVWPQEQGGREELAVEAIYERA